METIIDSLKLYKDHGIEPGSFLTAVLENDLRGACARADGVNIHRIPEIVKVVEATLPRLAWGSTARVSAWVTGGFKPAVVAQ